MDAQLTSGGHVTWYKHTHTHTPTHTRSRDCNMTTA